jgi:Mg2+ and Co2+ transporter CorA
MSEFEWPHGQTFAFGLCAFVTLLLALFFRRKRWI